MDNSVLETTALQEKTSQATIVIDLKYHRIRIHRSTLQLLGNPDYIQLLVNPDSHVIALLPSNQQDYLAHKIYRKKLSDKQCFELYSKPLVETITRLCYQWQSDCSYRMDGQKISSQNIILFSLATSYPVRL